MRERETNVINYNNNIKIQKNVGTLKCTSKKLMIKNYLFPVMENDAIND